MTFMQKRCLFHCQSVVVLRVENPLKLQRNCAGTDHKTVKRFIARTNQTRKRCDKGVKRKISRRQMSTIKREAVKQSLLTSKQIFEQAGVSGITRTILVSGYSTQLSETKYSRNRNFLQDNCIPWYHSNAQHSGKRCNLHARQRTIVCCSFHC